MDFVFGFFTIYHKIKSLSFIVVYDSTLETLDVSSSNHLSYSCFSSESETAKQMTNYGINTYLYRIKEDKNKKILSSKVSVV